MIRRFVLGLISVYQYFSRLTPPVCRFYPTCSEYARESITRYGLTRGLLLSAKRLLRCHPYHAGGYDPVE